MRGPRACPPPLPWARPRPPPPPRRRLLRPPSPTARRRAPPLSSPSPCGARRESHRGRSPWRSCSRRAPDHGRRHGEALAGAGDGAFAALRALRCAKVASRRQGSWSARRSASPRSRAWGDPLAARVRQATIDFKNLSVYVYVYVLAVYEHFHRTLPGV